MNKGFIFVLGAAVGSLLTWKFVENKYRKIADEEIESVVERFKIDRVQTEMTPEGLTIYDKDGNAVVKFHERTAQVADYNTQLEDLEYTQAGDECTIELQPDNESIAPYIISPEEYDEFGNETKSWTLYTDGVLTNEIGEIVGDYENIIGDALDYIGEYEDDCIHVRNENLEWDIEIIKIDKSFEELNKGDN